jgi:alkanesulfonate monooxygenase SsuD/methylene tetrahydromethanopterin reductase-like flavin-dependent oxidoreductase (luciferase family)
MYGVKQRDHEKRYEYAQEWLDAVKLAWGPQDDLNFHGEYIKLTNIRAKPKPYGGTRPLIMNAGASATGRAYALRNCDAFFTQASRRSPEETAQRVRDVKAEAANYGREIDVYTVGVITCRPTRNEAEEYYRHCIVDNADWSAVDLILAKKNISRETVGEAMFNEQRTNYANGMGGVPIVGDPDTVARELAQLASAGAKGVALSFVNYLDELPFFRGQVLPRLARMGLRELG